jgi:hypothetical protein
MIESCHRETLVETLLNTLEAERYVRGPLLETIIDELSVGAGLETATKAARGILEGLESGQLVESDFVSRVGALRQLVQSLSAAPASESRAETRIEDALARAMPAFGSSKASASAA